MMLNDYFNAKMNEIADAVARGGDVQVVFRGPDMLSMSAVPNAVKVTFDWGEGGISNVLISKTPQGMWSWDDLDAGFHAQGTLEYIVWNFEIGGIPLLMNTLKRIDGQPSRHPEA